MGFTTTFKEKYDSIMYSNMKFADEFEGDV